MRYDKSIFESAHMQGMLARHLQNRNRQEGKRNRGGMLAEDFAPQ
jgi:hypothetical protein